jgi:hypothetical protein
VQKSRILNQPIRASSDEPNGSAALDLPILDRMSDDLKANAAAPHIGWDLSLAGRLCEKTFSPLAAIQNTGGLHVEDRGSSLTDRPIPGRQPVRSTQALFA